MESLEAKRKYFHISVGYEFNFKYERILGIDLGIHKGIHLFAHRGHKKQRSGRSIWVVSEAKTGRKLTEGLIFDYVKKRAFRLVELHSKKLKYGIKKHGEKYGHIPRI